MAAALRRNPRLLLSLRTHHHFCTLSTEPNPNPNPKPSHKPQTKPISHLKTLIRAESDPDRIADLFLSSAHLPRFHSDRPLFQLTLHRLFRRRRPDLIERLLEHQRTDPLSPKSEGFQIRILSLYSSSQMLDQVLRTFHQIPSVVGRPHSDRSFCALLTAFLDNKRFDLVQENFQRLSKELNITPGVVAHNIVLRSLCESGDVDAARQLLDEMRKREETMPNIISYNTVLDGFLKKGDDNGFDEIVKEIAGNGLEPNVVTYNYRIAKFCKKAESFKAEELLDVMASKNVLPNLTSFNAVIDGFCKEGDVSSAVRVFKKMRIMKRVNGKDGVSPNSDSYIVLIRSLVEKGEFGLGLEICRECLIRKFAPPFEIVKGLIDGLMKDSKVEDAKDVIEKMKVVVKGDAADAWKKLEGALTL